jgi:outer membrane biosynthesis protein TonB
MATFDSLPPDQRAVLQMVLGRGRGYDDIAQMLSIDRAGVRDRALAALDALGPRTRITAQRRHLITDYLLGQLPSRIAEETRDHMADSPSERAWARVIAAELAPLASGPLPEIPVEGGRRPAPEPEPELEGAEQLALEPEPVPEPEPEPESEPAAAEPEADAPEPAPEPTPVEPRSRTDEPRRRAGEPVVVGRAVSDGEPEGEGARLRPDYGLRDPGAAGGRQSSRLGGAVLLGLGAVIILAVVIFFIANSGSSSKHHSKSASTTVASTSTPTSTSTGTSSTPTSTTATPVAQINLVAPSGSKSTTGIAEILKRGATTAVAIVGQGIPANTKHNAYAVWLYNSPSDCLRLGFVNPGVGKNGHLETAGGLPADASHYKEVLISLETTANPKSPGSIVLEGDLTLGQSG